MNTHRPLASVLPSDYSSEPPATLSNCDREPIHIPNLIQPHGVLLGLSEPDLVVVQVSHNAEERLALPPSSLLNQSIDVLLDDKQTNQLREHLKQPGPIPALRVTRSVRGALVSFHAIFHRSGGLLVAELEPADLSVAAVDFSLLNHTLAQLQRAASITEFCQVAAEEMRTLTGFDRVMIYRFAPNYDGEVIAEAKRDDLTPFLGLHYPASDIPVQARQLYEQNWLRIIPDVNYAPVGLTPLYNPLTGTPLDMRFSVLRSVSPLHIEYLQNMGVAASMSVSIIKDGKLWGLFACHHTSPHRVPYPIRNTCEFLGRTFSMMLLEKERIEDAEYKVQIKSVLAKLFEYMTKSDDFLKGLYQNEKTVLDLIAADGVALFVDNELILLGNTPAPEDIQELVNWLPEHVPEDVFHTASLSAHYPEADRYKDTASGLLAISVSKVQHEYILWFRPEVARTVRWAGNPNKPVDDGFRLSPRKSFDTWVQRVSGTALDWKAGEISAVTELRTAIVDAMFKLSGELKLRADILGRLNAELEQSNNELDSFAYIASHDLREPLRGIHNYAEFLLEDYAGKLDENGVGKLKTLVRLSERMDELIESLLHFSRVGRLELSLRQTDLNVVLENVLDLLRLRIEQSSAQITVPQPLPQIVCDPIRTGEVFSNLISNALKYNDKPNTYVEVGFRTVPVLSKNEDPNQPEPVNPAYVFYVRDNGIGIAAKHYENVFKIFKRLHGRDKFGGGTGAGLTIVKKIVERHNGKIWIESALGEGTTFFFTLSGQAPGSES